MDPGQPQSIREEFGALHGQQGITTSAVRGTWPVLGAAGSPTVPLGVLLLGETLGSFPLGLGLGLGFETGARGCPERFTAPCWPDLTHSLSGTAARRAPLAEGASSSEPLISE
jgi:hypothetical protein